MLEYETETDKFEFMLAKIIVWSRNNVEKTSRSLKHFWTEYYITQITKRIFGFLNTVAQSATSEYTCVIFNSYYALDTPHHVEL